MSRARGALAVLAGAVVLFVYYGVAQALPWGAASASSFSSTSGQPYVAVAGGLREEPPGTWVTEAFDDEFVGRVSTLATDRSFSWIFSVPSSDYDLGRYFAWHALTQLAVAMSLFFGLRLLAPLSRRRRLLVVASVAAAAAFATHGTMMNWLGMSPRHGLGESFHLIASWLLACAAMDRISGARSP